MIINIRGTSGSGKSTVVREAMKLCQENGIITPVHQAGRKRPVGYVCEPYPVSKDPLVRSMASSVCLEGTFAVVGHYDTACGGCDTIPKMEMISNLVREFHGRGFHVLYEGLLISPDCKWIKAMREDGLPVHVLALDTPLHVCLASINDRRRARKPEATDVNPKNTESKWNQVRSSMARLVDLGIPCEWVTRESALPRLRQLLEV
jgi:thymidylate kinase